VGRARTLLVLLALAAVTSALVWWDRGRPSTDDARAARGRLAPDFDRARATSVIIERAGETVRLEREGSSWWIASPRRRADDAAVDAILGELEFGSVERRLFPDDAGRARMGLAPPRVTLTCGATVLRIGGDAPGGRSVYVERAGEVLVVERRLTEVADRTRAQLTSMRLALESPNAAREVGIGPFGLERRAGGWFIRNGPSARTDPKSAAALFDAIDRARATRVLDEPPPAQSPGLLLMFDERPQAAVGDACPGHDGERLVRREDGVWLCFDQKTIDAAAPVSLNSLVERRVVPLAIDDVRSVAFHGASPFTLERVRAGWQLRDQRGAVAPADDTAVREWWSALAALGGEPQPVLASGTPMLTIATADDQLELAVDDRRKLVFRSGEEFRYALSREQRALLQPAPGRFRPRRIFDFSADDVERVTIEERGRERAVHAADGRWTLDAPERLDGDDALVARFVDALAGLRAERFEPGAKVAPVRRVRVDVRARDGGAAELELALGPARDGGCLAERASGDAPPFRLAADTCALLSSHLASRRLFDVREDRLRGLDVERGAERLHAERRSGGWFDRDRGERLPAARIDALVARLRALAADSVEGYGNLPQLAARMIVRIETEGAAEQTLELASPSGRLSRARLRGRPVRYLVPSADVDALVAAARP
jgi:hypothetical protein